MDHDLNISYTGLVQFLTEDERTQYCSQFLQAYGFQLILFVAFWYFYCRNRHLEKRLEMLEEVVEEAIHLIEEIGEEVDDMQESDSEETDSGGETDSGETEETEDSDYEPDEDETIEE